MKTFFLKYKYYLLFCISALFVIVTKIANYGAWPSELKDSFTEPNGNTEKKKQNELSSLVSVNDKDTGSDGGGTVSIRLGELDNFKVVDRTKLIDVLVDSEGRLNLQVANGVIEQDEFLNIINTLQETATLPEQQLAAQYQNRLIQIRENVPHTANVQCSRGVCALHMTNIRNQDIVNIEPVLVQLGFGAFTYTPMISDGLYGEVRVISNGNSGVSAVTLN
jgi:hypothetical protein